MAQWVGRLPRGSVIIKKLTQRRKLTFSGYSRSSKGCQYAVNNSITTLAQAAQYLIHAGAVDMDTMQVEGKQLLDVCGLSHTAKNWGSVCERQIVKHNLIDNIDYTSHTDVGRSRALTFTLNAAKHILLTAMTDKGKAARTD